MELHNAEFGGDAAPDMVTMWNGSPPARRIRRHGSPSGHWAQARRPTPSIFRHLELVPGALDTLRSARTARDTTIVIVTSKPDWAVPTRSTGWQTTRSRPTRSTSPSASTTSTATCTSTTRPNVLPDLVRTVRTPSCAASFGRGTIRWNRRRRRRLGPGFHQLVTVRSPRAVNSTEVDDLRSPRDLSSAHLLALPCPGGAHS